MLLWHYMELSESNALYLSHTFTFSDLLEVKCRVEFATEPVLRGSVGPAQRKTKHDVMKLRSFRLLQAIITT